MRARSLRCGSALSGAILVIVCLALVLGLALPYIQKTQEAAARTTSQCNLKMIGMAMHNYASAHEGQLPNAGFVRSISQVSNIATDWTVACHPDDIINKFGPDW